MPNGASTCLRMSLSAMPVECVLSVSTMPGLMALQTRTHCGSDGRREWRGGGFGQRRLTSAIYGQEGDRWKAGCSSRGDLALDDRAD